MMRNRTKLNTKHALYIKQFIVLILKIVKRTIEKKQKDKKKLLKAKQINNN